MRDELDRLVGEVEPRFEISQKIEQVAPQPGDLRRESPRQLIERRLQLAFIAGIDHSQDRLSLRQVDSPGKKCPQREFPRLCRTHPAREQVGENCFQDRRRRDRVQFGERLTCITPAIRPQVQIDREVRGNAGDVQDPRVTPRCGVRERLPRLIERFENSSGLRAADADDASRRMPCRRGKGCNRVVGA